MAIRAVFLDCDNLHKVSHDKQDGSTSIVANSTSNGEQASPGRSCHLWLLNPFLRQGDGLPVLLPTSDSCLPASIWQGAGREKGFLAPQNQAPSADPCCQAVTVSSIAQSRLTGNLCLADTISLLSVFLSESRQFPLHLPLALRFCGPYAFGRWFAGRGTRWRREV